MGDELSTRLPDELAVRLNRYSSTLHPYDETQAEIHILRHQTQPTLYLKIRYGEDRRLVNEYTMIKWINQRVPTPKLLYYTFENSVEYLLTTEIEGIPAYQIEPNSRESAIKVLAGTLRVIHGIDMDGCPVENSVENWLNKFYAKGIDTSSLEEWRPKENQVFTHGDYCLPNIIIKNGKLSGVIDWDYAGLADPYIDFAYCTWSIKYNYGVEESEEQWIPLFFKHYGLEKIDKKKLDYFRKLMELI